MSEAKEYTTVTIDRETHENLKSIANGMPLMAFLRQLASERAKELRKKQKSEQLYNDLFKYVFSMDITDEDSYQKFLSGAWSLLISSTASDMGKVTIADPEVIASCRDTILIHMPSCKIRDDLLGHLDRYEKSLNQTEEENYSNSKVMYDSMYYRAIVLGDENTLNTLMFMLKTYVEDESELGEKLWQEAQEILGPERLDKLFAAWKRSNESESDEP